MKKNKTLSYSAVKKDYLNTAKTMATDVVEIDKDACINHSNASALERHIASIKHYTTKISTIKNNKNFKDATKILKNLAKLVMDASNEELKNAEATRKLKVDKIISDYDLTFSKSFNDKTINFYEYNGLLTINSIKDIMKDDIFNFSDFLYNEYDYGEDQLGNKLQYISTDSSSKTREGKYKPFISFCEDKNYDWQIKDFIIAKEVIFSKKLEDIDNDVDPWDLPFLGTKFLSNSITIISKGIFNPIDLTNLSEKDKKEYNDCLIQIHKLYTHLCSFNDDSDDYDVTFKQIKEYSGITGDHGIFSNYALLS